jgi:hypothetical protein
MCQPEKHDTIAELTSELRIQVNDARKFIYFTYTIGGHVTQIAPSTICRLTQVVRRWHTFRTIEARMRASVLFRVG